MSAVLTSEGAILSERRDDVVIVSLHRESRRNAMNLTMWQGLCEAVQAAAEDLPRALIVTGVGPHFCAGMDLKPDNPITLRAGQAIFQTGAGAGRALITELKQYLEPLLNFPAPTIAAIEGVAVGGGYEVALHCDMRVAARNARISLPEARIGMIPDLGGTALLTRLVGVGRAAMVICSTREYTGEQAQALGMVEELAEPGEALATALELAADIRRGAPTAVALALQTIRESSDLNRSDALALETRRGGAALATPAAREGLNSFVEKRQPVW